MTNIIPINQRQTKRYDAFRRECSALNNDMLASQRTTILSQRNLVRELNGIIDLFLAGDAKAARQRVLLQREGRFVAPGNPQ